MWRRVDQGADQVPMPQCLACGISRTPDMQKARRGVPITYLVDFCWASFCAINSCFLAFIASRIFEYSSVFAL